MTSFIVNALLRRRILSRRASLPDTFSRLAVALAVATLLSACADQHGIVSQVTLRSPDSFASDGSLTTSLDKRVAWPTEDWVEQLGGAPLKALVEEALANNPDLDAAQARVRQAAALIQTATAATKLQVDGALSTTRERFSENFIYPPPYGGAWFWDSEAALNFSYDFDFWGKHRTQIEAAVSSTKAADAENYAARLMLTNAVATAWVKLSLQQAQLALIDETLNARHALDALTQQRKAAGLDTQSDNNQNRLQTAPLENQRAQLNESIALSRNLLASLLGKGPDRGRSIDAPAMPNAANLTLPDRLPAGLLGRRPDIVAARWRVEAAQSTVEIAKTAFYPNINIKAMLGLSSLDFDKFLTSGSRGLSVGPALTLPIFEGGALRAQLANDTGAYDQAVASYNKALNDALHEVADQVRSLESLDQQQVFQQHATDAASNSLALAQQRQQVGTGNMLQVVSAQLGVYQQTQQNIMLAGQRIQLQVALIKSLGGGFDADREGLTVGADHVAKDADAEVSAADASH